MPLYVDDEIINAQFCEPVANALKAIKYEMQGRAVTPSFALGLMKKHLLPLLPVEHQIVFGKLTQVSWSKLHWGYSDLVFRSRESGKMVEDIGVCVDWICTYTTLPPRALPIFENLETNIFLQTCGYLKTEVAHLRYVDSGKFDVFKACKYCWRQPVPSRHLCVVHTASEKHVSSQPNGNEHVDESAFTSYKEGARQKKAYDKTINKMLTKETIQFHESGFADPILLPIHKIWPWLIERRPLLAELLVAQHKATDDARIVDGVLSILHTPSNLTGRLLRPYTVANRHIKEYPILIWLMLLRAEAWLETRHKTRGNWGGSRSNIKAPLDLNVSGEAELTNHFQDPFKNVEEPPINE